MFDKFVMQGVMDREYSIFYAGGEVKLHLVASRVSHEALKKLN